MAAMNLRERELVEKHLYLAAYLTDIAEAATGRYRRKSSVKTYWDALPHADIDDSRAVKGKERMTSHLK